MRWQRLFADLEGQAIGWALAERDGEVADRLRAEAAQTVLADRLRAHRGRGVTLEVAGVGPLSGPLDAVGDGWLLVGGQADHLVVASAVQAIRDLEPRAVGEAAMGEVARRLRLTTVLRAVARDRSAVEVRTVDGARWTGTPDRVGGDWLDLVVHDPGSAPRRNEVRGRMTVALARLATVSWLPGGARG